MQALLVPGYASIVDAAQDDAHVVIRSNGPPVEKVVNARNALRLALPTTPSGPSDLLRDASNGVSQLRMDHVAAQAREVLASMSAALAHFDLSGLPPLELVQLDDGSAVLQWVFPERRFAFSFEPKRSESGWIFVSSPSSGGVQAYGASLEPDLRWLLAWTLRLMPAPRS